MTTGERIRERRRALNMTQNELRRQMPKPKPKREVSREDCDRFIERFCRIEQMDREEQKSLLRKTVDQIAVTPEDIGLFMTVKRGVVIAINKQ